MKRLSKKKLTKFVLVKTCLFDISHVGHSFYTQYFKKLKIIPTQNVYIVIIF